MIDIKSYSRVTTLEAQAYWWWCRLQHLFDYADNEAQRQRLAVLERRASRRWHRRAATLLCWGKE